MNLQEEILKIRSEMLDEFDKRVEALKVDEQEFPQDGDKYWYVGATGRIFNSEWDGFASTEGMLEIDNVYKTKQEAEFAAEKLRVEAELRKFSRPFKKGEKNWIILFDSLRNRLEISWSGGLVHPGTVYFENKTEAVKAVYNVGGDRIKKYIFGVED